MTGESSYDDRVEPSPAANATARAERAGLCDLLLAVGPDAPTLCTGWTARDLAAHLLVREGRPDAAAGLVVGPLAGHLQRVQAQVADEDFSELVRRVRDGPPRWTLLWVGPLEAAVNTVEFFVHHEDVRRAQPEWAPRELSGAAPAQLWSALRRGGAVLARHCPVGILVRPTDGPDAGTVVRLREGPATVTLTGPVPECVLALYGRPTCGLQVEGDPPDVAAFHGFRR